MDIAILTRDSGLYANRRFAQSAMQRGLSLRLIDVLPVFDADVHHCAAPDVVVARYTPRWHSEGDRQLRALEAAGAKTLNSADAIAFARSVPASQKSLQAVQIPMPLSQYCPPNNKNSVLENLPFDFPMVIKREFSAQGEGVQLLPHYEVAAQVVARLQEQGCGFTLQEYVAESGGCDLRLFVLEGRVLAAMKRCARQGEFRANIHQGGHAVAYRPSAMEIEMACKAAGTLGLGMAGVDLIHSKNGPLLLEVNACPGFEALERVSGCEIAGQILDLLIHRQN